MSCESSLSIGSLPIAGGAAAAGIASAKAAEAAIAGIGSAESAGTATSPGTARHHVTQDQARQKAAASAAPIPAGSARAEQEEKQKDPADYRRPGNGVGGRTAYVAGKLRGGGYGLCPGSTRAQGLRAAHQRVAL